MLVIDGAVWSTTDRVVFTLALTTGTMLIGTTGAVYLKTRGTIAALGTLLGGILMSGAFGLVALHFGSSRIVSIPGLVLFLSLALILVLFPERIERVIGKAFGKPGTD